MKTFVFYHNDADGKAAANVVFNKTGDIGYNYREIDYNTEFPIKDIGDGDCVWIVDFSIDPDIMRRLLRKTDRVTWIDHHISAIEKYKGFEGGIDGLRSCSYSGCELTWLYCNAGIYGNWKDIPEKFLEGCPRYIRLIGDRDTWKFEFGDESRYLHEAFMSAGEPGPLEHWWTVADVKLEDELETGEMLLSHTRGFYKNIVERAAYEAEFEGHKMLVCNCPIFTSELFGDRVNDYPFVAVYMHNGDNYKVSLYSVNMDVVEFAKKHGGGGHARACGFVCDEVPFRRIDAK
jgi:oligoribonuclease NrnB/cAMP/cGMP phosphodiesterase (DHH superfamily)